MAMNLITVTIIGNNYKLSGLMMNAHVFVDESKARGLLLAAAVIPPEELARMRKLVDSLRLPRQRRIHFTAESDARRKIILTALAGAGTRAIVYDASAYKDIKRARDTALSRLVDDSAKLGARMLVIERDDQSEASDRAIIRSRAEIAGCLDQLRYVHKRSHEECLLSIPDAVAWTWAKAGHWRQRVEGIVAEVVHV
jgi:hypothetical protein